MRRLLRKLIRILFNRNTLIILIMLIQVVALVLTVLFLSQHYLFIYLVLMALNMILVVYITNTSENPSYKIPWLIAMMIMPLFAGLAYLLVKTDLGSRLLKRAYGDKVMHTRELLPQNPHVMEDLTSLDPGYAGLANYVAEYGGYPIYRNHISEYYADGESMFESMKREIQTAKRYVFLEFFIISSGKMWDEMLELLKERAAAGVDVRVMYDGFGTQFMMPRKYFADLKKYGITCKVFNSFQPFLSSAYNNRDHRKILIVDGHTAFTGGINIADEYINQKLRFGHWKDGGMLCRGEAVWSFTVMFLQLWDIDCADTKSMEQYAALDGILAGYDGFIQPYSDSPTDEEYVGRNVYLDIINNARDYVYIMTPYLIPDHELVTALGLAAKKGVDVRLMTPHIPDKWYAYNTAWSYYPELLDAKVRIFEYEPGFVHAKNFSADDKIGVVGTINLDYRSLYLHFECAAVLYGSSMVCSIRKDFENSLERCIEITKEDCLKRPLYKRIVGWILRILAPLL
ncbi:MAG: cardiolipin synthase [Oscillospiraceae bacterium]|nr:cardiolipin synthase [Oscillospiraceae bacterium]